MRTIVMLLSILLSTTLLFVSFSIGTSYESAQRKMARGMAGSATISVKGKDGKMEEKEIPKLSSIGACVGMVEGKALYHENGYYESIDLIGADMDSLCKINPPRLLEGTEITGFTGNKVVLPERFTEKYGIKKGDSITLEVNGSQVKLQVSDIAAYDTVFLRHTRGATALLPVETLYSILNQESGYQEILIKPAEGVSTASLKHELEKFLSNKKYEVSETVNEAKIVADARQKSMPFFLISFFALTMSVFIIYSSYKVITLDRLPVIGTFRSIGATEKMVTRILLLESILYGTTGGLLGIPIGIGVLKIILSGMGQSLSQGIEIPVIISPLGVIVSLAVAIIVSMLSAWMPVKKASRLPIKDVVLGTVEETKVSHRIIIGTGVMLFVVSAILPRLASGKALYIAGGFSLLGLITATVLIVPLLTNLLSRAFEWLYGLLPGNECRLAARNMRDNKSIVQNITLLFISISAVIAITVVGSFVTTYVADVFKGAELQGFVDGQMNEEFVNKVRKIEGVDKVLPLYVLNNKVTAGSQKLSRVEATDHLDVYNAMLALNYSNDSMKRDAVSKFNQGRSVILSEEMMKRLGASLGGTVTLAGGDSKFEYQIVGSFKSRATDVEAVIPSSCAVSDFGMKTYGFLAYTAADPDAVMIQVRDMFGDESNWSRTVEEFNKDALTTVGAFLQPMQSMTWFILALATIGVINNLMIHYLQRRRSIAMYKSVGLSNRQNVKITLMEGLTSGLIGAVIASFVSYMEIQTIFLVAGPKIAVTPNLSITTFLSAGAMGIVVTLIGSIVPILKSRRMKLVEEIKFE